MNKLYIGIGLMLLSALLTASGQAFWKLAIHGLASWQLYVGFICYGAGALIMTLAFRFGSLSVLHPLLSLGYVLSILIGVYFLHESMTVHTVLGDLVIVAGAFFLGVGGKKEQAQQDQAQQDQAQQTKHSQNREQTQQ